MSITHPTMPAVRSDGAAARTAVPRRRPHGAEWIEAAEPGFRGLAVVARGGVEPPTYRFSVGRSYQLSYLAKPGETLPQGALDAKTWCPAWAGRLPEAP